MTALLKVCLILIIVYNVSSKYVPQFSQNPFLSTKKVSYYVPNVSKNPFLQGYSNPASSISSINQNPFLTNKVVLPNTYNPTKTTRPYYSPNTVSDVFNLDSNPFLSNKKVTKNPPYKPTFTYPATSAPNSNPNPTNAINQNPFLTNKVTKNPPYKPTFTYPATSVPNSNPNPTNAINQNPFLTNKVTKNPPYVPNFTNPTAVTPNIQPNPPNRHNEISSISGDTSTNSVDLNYLESICGLVDNSISLIAHGDDAIKSDYPWLGALFKSANTEPKFLCGATLITKKHALTAGHCINGVSASRFYLILGRSDINNWLTGGEQIRVNDTHLHENYIPRQGDGDIAILKLSKEVRFTAVIRPICLWTADDELNVIVGLNGLVVGWGVDENERFPSEPKKATLPIVSNEECLRSHDGFRLITSTRTFCAGNRDESGPCRGDSGSGFYLEENGRWRIRGIVSVGIMVNNTCDLTNYVAFVDASKYRSWILSYITQE